MSRAALLSKRHWRPFLHLPGFGKLPHPALAAADSFFDHIAEYGLADPNPGDVAVWARAHDPEAVAALLDDLARAMAVCIPQFVDRVREAGQLPLPAASRVDPPEAASRPASARAGLWDPIAPPSRRPPRARRVSVQPWDLPEAMQNDLRRLAVGLPRNGVSVCRDIAHRMREKLCQLVWSARNAALPEEISNETVARYQADVEARSASGKNGLRWATVRAAIEEIDRYARYAGLPVEIRKPIAERLAVLCRREDMQKALKFAELARTGNTTLSALDMADTLLQRALGEADPKRRHRLRNGACILGIYPVAPLRNASATLIFARTLFWRHDHWVIDMLIQKTMAHNPEPFVMPLEPEHGRFIEAVLLGDQHPRYLPRLRQDALAAQRQLFVLHDGRPAASTYVPRIYKALTDNSFTTTRSMLHTEFATSLGVAGRDMAMAACHQTSARTAKKYEADSVAIAAVSRRQATSSVRRTLYGLRTELGEL